METDPAHLVPEWGLFFQKARQPLAAGCHLAANPGVQVPPDILQGVCGQILGPLHGGSAQEQGIQFRRWRRDHLEGGISIFWRMAEFGQVPCGQVSPVSQGWRQGCFEPLGGQRKQAFGLAGAKGLQHPLDSAVGSRLERTVRLFIGGCNRVQATGR